MSSAEEYTGAESRSITRLSPDESSPERELLCAGPEEREITERMRRIKVSPEGDGSGEAFAEVEHSAASGDKKASLLFWMALLLAFIAVLALSVTQTALFLREILPEYLALGGLYQGVALFAAAVAGLVFCALVFFILKETYLLLRLRHIAGRRRDVEAALRRNSKEKILRICASLEVNNQAETGAACAQWLAEAAYISTAEENLILYNRRVLAIADRKAKKIIAGHGLAAAALVAVSPFALSDMLVILMNNRVMLNRIAACYGIRLGFASRLKLWERIVRDMIWGAGVSMVPELVAGKLVNKNAGAIFGKAAAEGLRAGFSAACLGINAVKICRPLPLRHSENKFGCLELCGSIIELMQGKTAQGNRE
jgi:putative membrane protein